MAQGRSTRLTRVFSKPPCTQGAGLHCERIGKRQKAKGKAKGEAKAKAIGRKQERAAPEAGKGNNTGNLEPQVNVAHSKVH